MPNLILYGGTFDPVHNGHIQLALHVQHHWHFDRFIWLPCHIPALKKSAHASAEHRVNMLTLGIAPYTTTHRFSIDTQEIMRSEPSYTVHTLMAYRKQWGHDVPITFMLGADSLNTLPQWYQWEKILTLCNLLVLARSAARLHLPAPLLPHHTQHEADLVIKPNGCIMHYDAGQFCISSTTIRARIAAHQEIQSCLPPPVHHYIQQHHLYDS